MAQRRPSTKKKAPRRPRGKKKASKPAKKPSRKSSRTKGRTSSKNRFLMWILLLGALGVVMALMLKTPGGGGGKGR